jgi:hypothetical protein
MLEKKSSKLIQKSTLPYSPVYGMQDEKVSNGCRMLVHFY